MNTISYIGGRDYKAQPHLTTDFAYDLPDALIAQTPAVPRDSCRLLVLNSDTGEIENRTFTDIVEYLNPGDVLVVNETRVLPARLTARRKDTGAEIEVLLLKQVPDGEDSIDTLSRSRVLGLTDELSSFARGFRPTCGSSPRKESSESSDTDNSTETWQCLVRPGKKARVGHELEFLDSAGFVVMTGIVVNFGSEGTRHIRLTPSEGTVSDIIHAIGSTPLPPYITKQVADAEQYQTVYARDEHSAAAPTAGLHFTPELLKRIQDKGVILVKVRLDVGLDTFRPVTVDDPTQHHIHTEYISVPQETVDAILTARSRGGRIISVGTTTARALESAYQATRLSLGSDHQRGSSFQKNSVQDRNQNHDCADQVHRNDSREGVLLEPFAGTSGLFIMPGYAFGVVDDLITNFHVPCSTLMMMVSALAGRDTIIDAYREAVAQKYRFLSFGDAMLIRG